MSSSRLSAGICRRRCVPGTTKNREGETFPFGSLPELRAVQEAQRAATDDVERATKQIIPWVFHRQGRPVRFFRRS